MARWEEALDAQLELFLFASSDRGKMYADGWGRSFASSNRTQADMGYKVAERIQWMAFHAEPFYVDPDMQTLWEAAAPGFNPEALLPQDILTPTGFVWLPRPTTSRDIHGKTTSWRALAWHEVVFNGYTLTDDEAGEAKQEYDQRAEVKGVVIAAFHRVGDPDDYDNGEALHMAEDEWVPYADINQKRIRRGDLQVDHIMPWAYGEAPLQLAADYPVAMNSLYRNTSKRDDPRNFEKPVQCLWRLMQQTIFTRTKWTTPRSTRRRAKRENFPEKQVTVVKLRRPRLQSDTGHGDEAEPVEWTHRWLVSGHWRNQPYPSLGPDVTRQIWISPYVKGPESKPLEVRKLRVFELVR